MLVPQFRVDVRRADLERAGLKAGGQRRGELLETARAGRTVTEILEGNRACPVVVLVEGSGAAGAEDLRRLPVSLPNGAQAPLSDFADVPRRSSAHNQILRDDAERRVAVSFNVEGRDLGSVVAELRTRLAREVEPHLGRGATVCRDRRAVREPGGGVPHDPVRARPVVELAIVFFVLLWAHSTSIGAVLQVLLNVPFALIGSVVAVSWGTGGVVSIAHLVGFVSLTGIAARNGIMMISGTTPTW